LFRVYSLEKSKLLSVAPDLVDAKIKEAKEKVLDWFKEENFLPEERQHKS